VTITDPDVAARAPFAFRA
jgi:aldehyde dehydrogenase (NAD+)